VREIKKITVVNQNGAESYQIGNVINGLKIERIVDCSMETLDSLRIGYHCLSSDRNIRENSIVEIWDCPVTVEYYEVQP